MSGTVKGRQYYFTRIPEKFFGKEKKGRIFPISHAKRVIDVQ